MKLIQKILDIKLLLIIENNLIYRSKNILYVNSKEISIEKNIEYLFKSNEILFAKSNENLVFLDFSDNKFKNLIKYKTEEFQFIGKNKYIFIDYDSNENLFEISFFNNNSIVWKLNLKYFFNIEFENSNILIKRDTLKTKHISLIDTEKGFIKWEYRLPENFEIYLKPYLISNILYFTAYNQFQKNQLVTGLDIETGKVIWQHQYEVTSANKFISAPAFNEKNQLFYGIGHIYQVFNPKTGEIVLEKIFDESKNYNLLVDAQAIYDNKLWFVSGGGRNTKFGYVNIDTHKLEFLQDLPHEEYEVFDTPVFHEGKLYLRGKHQNNLYVFE